MEENDINLITFGPGPMEKNQHFSLVECHPSGQRLVGVFVEGMLTKGEVSFTDCL